MSHLADSPFDAVMQFWDLPLLPRLTAGQVATFVGGVLLLTLIHLLINRLANLVSPPSKEHDPRESWLSLIVWVLRQPLVMYMWACGLSGLFLTQLAPWLNFPVIPPVRAHPVFPVLTIIAAGFVVLRALRAATRKLRDASLAEPTQWRGAWALLSVRALQVLLPLLTIRSVLPLLPIPPARLLIVAKLFTLLVIASVGFLAGQLLVEFERVAIARRNKLGEDRATRRAVTQISVLRKIGVVVIALLTIACMLMVFDSVRHFGQSLLASAGLAGIIAGVAAQKSLSTLFAGLQIAVTQPISLGDSVTVENEYGTVEDITLTYVVVRLWDQRRMVLPIGYFLEKPFINWTRRAESLLGEVRLPVEFSAPVGKVREELDRLLAADSRWDGGTKNLEVSDASGTGMQLRVVVSARNTTDLGGLRAQIRESLIEFLSRNHAGALPQNRTVLERRAAAAQATEAPAPPR